MESYGIASLIPIVVTIFIAMKFKRLLTALLVGSFLGLLIINNFNPFVTLIKLVDEFIIPTIGDSWNAKILLLLVAISGFVKLLEVSGGTFSFADGITKKVKSKRATMLVSWLGGFAVFWSDVGSPLVVGPIFRPLYDKLRISREKLAWIADTTASPVSILIPFLGWGAYIMGLMSNELPNQEMFPLLLQTIPFNFYALLSVLFVPFIILVGMDLKPMARAEKRAQKGIIHAEDLDEVDVEEVDQSVIEKSNIWVMVIPLVVFIGSLVLLQPAGFPFAEGSASNIELNLIIAVLYGSAASIILMKFYKIKKFGESATAFFDGLKGSSNIIFILIVAWVLGGVSKALGAPDFLVSVAQGNLATWAIPLIIFISAALISFSTGSSWGTFSIMMPLAIPLALELDSSLLAVTIAAVLSGGLFGDHCSPISDTTILSGTGASCNLVAHVRTQLPYALFVASAAIVSFIIAGITKSPISLLIGVVFLYGIFLLVTRLFNIHKPMEETVR